MQWPFKTTVRLAAASGGVLRHQYAVRAITASDAKMELERRFLEEEIPGSKSRTSCQQAGNRNRSGRAPLLRPGKFQRDHLLADRW
jgi:hypothetical protein